MNFQPVRRLRVLLMKPQGTLATLVIQIAPIVVSITGLAQEQEEYQQWLKNQQETLQQFNDERDREFLEFLKQEWKQMQVFRWMTPDEKPKPLKMSVYQPFPE